MAQDFHAVFPFNDNDKMLNSADVAGVSLAAIQGLNQKVEAQSAQMQAKNAEIQDLKQSVAELKAMVEKLAGK
jgi:cell division protein FtsB